MLSSIPTITRNIFWVTTCSCRRAFSATKSPKNRWLVTTNRRSPTWQETWRPTIPLWPIRWLPFARYTRIYRSLTVSHCTWAGKRQIIHLEGTLCFLSLSAKATLFAGDNVQQRASVAQRQLALVRDAAAHQGNGREVIVPGTGAPGGKAIDPLYQYLAEMRRRIPSSYGGCRRECVEKVGMLDYFPIAKGQEGDCGAGTVSNASTQRFVWPSASGDRGFSRWTA